MNEARYREAERRLWASVGLVATERIVRLATLGTRLRVQEVGEGPPVLFLHGGPNAGSAWVPLLAHLQGFRCLLVDRPGTGLSEAYPVRASNVAAFGAAFPVEVLSALGVGKAHVVASSFGAHLSLRAAAFHPGRFDRMVLMGAPALIPGQTFPLLMRMLRSRRARRVLATLPPSRTGVRMVLREIGHRESLRDGRVPAAFIDWYRALQAHTDTMRHEGDLIADVLPRLEAVMLTPELLGAIRTPTMFLWGSNDAFGGPLHARRLTEMVPGAGLVVMPGAGHLPWLDDPAFVARGISDFLHAADAADLAIPGAARGDG